MTQTDMVEMFKNTFTGIVILAVLTLAVYTWGLTVNFFVDNGQLRNVVYFLPFALYLTYVMGGMYRSLRKK